MLTKCDFYSGSSVLKRKKKIVNRERSEAIQALEIASGYHPRNGTRMYIYYIYQRLHRSVHFSMSSATGALRGIPVL